MEIISEDSKKDYSKEIIGGKGKGLFKLKNLEKKLKEKYELSNLYMDKKFRNPNFGILPVGFNTKNKDAIMKFLDTLETERFAVRSSAPLEDGVQYSFDGVYDTFLNVHKEEVIEAIEQVKNSSMGKKAMKYSKKFNVPINENMAVILQEMVYGDSGIIYSKFPSSKDITKIIHETNNKKEVSIIERNKGEMFSYPCSGNKIITMNSLNNLEINDFADISYIIEKEFKHPVRIEYCFKSEKNKSSLSLLQSRTIAGIDKIKNIDLQEIENHNLIAGTYSVNGMGDVTLPAVVVFREDSSTFHVPCEEIKKLNSKYNEGYILIANYLTFNCYDVDELTYNKKAAIISGDGNIGGSNKEGHDWDIARQQNLLYLCIEDFKSQFNKNLSGKFNPPIKSGDEIRVVSDGVKGLVYKID